MFSFEIVFPFTNSNVMKWTPLSLLDRMDGDGVGMIARRKDARESTASCESERRVWEHLDWYRLSLGQVAALIRSRVQSSRRIDSQSVTSIYR